MSPPLGRDQTPPPSGAGPDFGAPEAREASPSDHQDLGAAAPGQDAPTAEPVLLSKAVIEPQADTGAFLPLTPTGGDDEAPSIGRISGGSGAAAFQTESPPAQLWVPPVVAGMQSGSAEPEVAPRPRRRPTPPPVPEDDDEELQPRRSGARRLLVLLVLAAAGAGAWYVATHHRTLLKTAESLATPAPSTVAAAGSAPAQEAAPEAPPPRAEPEVVAPSEPAPAEPERDDAREHRSRSRTRPGHDRRSAPAPSARSAPERARVEAPPPAPSRASVPAGAARSGTPASQPAAPAAAAAPATGDYYEVASGYLREKKVQLAIDELKRGLARSPRDAKSYRLLGMAYSLLGNEKSAVEAFERFVQLDPGHKDAPKMKAIIADYYKRHK